MAIAPAATKPLYQVVFASKLIAYFNTRQMVILVLDGDNRRESGTELKELLPDVSCETLDAALPKLLAAKRRYLDELGRRLIPSLLNEVGQYPQDNLQDKQALATMLNRTLRKLDLAICCPQTGLPATIIASNKASGSEASRFQLRVILPDGSAHKTKTFPSISTLELRSRDVGVDKETLWLDRIQGNRTSPPRSR